MELFDNINSILDFAIEREQEAVEFYLKLSDEAKDEEMQQIFSQFATEEMSHKAKLINVKEKGIFHIYKTKVTDLKIADYIVDIHPRGDMSYAEALILAMKREKMAFKLYQKLADYAITEDLRNVFLSLAIEEAKHKLRFEIEYDEFVLREN